MKRTPCKPGTIISWLDLTAVVVEDNGGDTLKVKINGSIQEWKWHYYMLSRKRVESCRVISVPEDPAPKSKPRSRNNRLSTVFRNAALFELWDGCNGDASRFQYSCSAVHWAAKRAKLSGAMAKKLYAKYFKPYGLSESEGWFPEFDPSPSYEKSQERRCFALLFMAEIVKDL